MSKSREFMLLVVVDEYVDNDDVDDGVVLDALMDKMTNLEFEANGRTFYIDDVNPGDL